MEGEIVYIGTMNVEGETLTGAFVMIDPDKLDGSMIYEDVTVESKSQLQALKEEVEERQVDNSDHDQGVQGWNSAIREILNLITNRGQ